MFIVTSFSFRFFFLWWKVAAANISLQNRARVAPDPKSNFSNLICLKTIIYSNLQHPALPRSVL
jgi:hypothetical protein